MMIIGCDLRTRYQQIAMLDSETGESRAPALHGQMQNATNGPSAEILSIGKTYTIGLNSLHRMEI
jgi:hypothetical protein